jgi:hypothetical protein
MSALDIKLRAMIAEYPALFRAFVELARAGLEEEAVAALSVAFARHGLALHRKDDSPARDRIH